MEGISKTVRDRLAAQQTASDHPDADLLTAYAENTLLARERDTVTAHLARCKACRDLALLAAPELPAVAPEPQVVAPEPRRRWFARPVYGWLAATAAIAVVGAGLTISLSTRSAHQSLAARQEVTVPTSPVAGPQPAPVAPASNSNEVASAQFAPQTKQQPSVQARAKKSAPLAPKSVIVDEYAVLQKKLPASSPAVFGFGEPSRTDALHQDMRVMREQNAVTIPSPASNKADVAAALRPPAAPPLHDAPIRAAESNSLILSQAPAGTSGLIANTDNAASVSGPVASDSVSATPGPVSQQENVPTAAAAPARAAAARRPAINAGTALSAMKTGAIGGPNVPGDASSVPQVACSTIADGLRCVYGTRTTELHKPDAKLNAFATMAENVWVGGKALFRSADAGSTWTEVNKPSDESVSQIVIMADAVYVRTPSGRMWKTTDNGATWLQTSATK